MSFLDHVIRHGTTHAIKFADEQVKRAAERYRDRLSQDPDYQAMLAAQDEVMEIEAEKVRKRQESIKAAKAAGMTDQEIRDRALAYFREKYL